VGLPYGLKFKPFFNPAEGLVYMDSPPQLIDVGTPCPKKDPISYICVMVGLRV
jgi:hypothetical protein